VAAGIPVFLALTAAAEAFGTVLSVSLAGIPIIIGAVVAGITLLALNWEKSMAAIKAAAAATLTFLTESFQGLSKVLQGALSLDPDSIIDGINQITGAFKKAGDTAVQTYQQITASQKAELQKQDEDKAAAAAKEAARRAQQQEILRQLHQAEIDGEKLVNEHASADLIALKQKEVSVLKALSQDKTAAEVEQLQIQLAQVRALEETQQSEDLIRAKDFEQAKLDAQKDFAAQGIAISAQLTAAQISDLQAKAQTSNQIDQQFQIDAISNNIKTQNQLLSDKKKYGETVATLNKTLGSDQVKAATSVSENLVGLQQSQNDVLKTIGKAAAITDISIKTAQSAEAVFTGMVEIFPGPVGVSLGIAGAAAAVAFGAERIGEVVAANDGGLITGGVPGKDSVPALLTPGELVVPEKNFDQVVQGYQTQQGTGGGNSEMIQLLRSIDQKFSNPVQNVFQGDVLSDQSFIERLIRGISDSLEFRNTTIFGVNT
jgi:hypothetical protein